jgi:hypothetical protein
MPGPAAEARGAAAAAAVLDAHRAANGGAFPETVAINLWGLDAIKTKVRLWRARVAARPELASRHYERTGLQQHRPL